MMVEWRAEVNEDIATDQECDEIETRARDRKFLHWPELIRVFNRLRKAEAELAQASRTMVGDYITSIDHYRVVGELKAELAQARNEALEEAATEAGKRAATYSHYNRMQMIVDPSSVCESIAAAIRALKGEPK